MSSTPKPPASPREFSPSLLDLGTLESLDSLPRAGQRSAEFSASLLDLGTPASLDCLPRAGLRAAEFSAARLDLGTPASLDCLPRASHHAGPELPPLSPRLYSADLAPTKAEGRRWGRYSLFALWTNDVHNIANYSFAIGLFALGMSGAQILAALALGALMVYGLMNLSGYMGQKTGLPYPVMCRIAFGIHGAQLPALIRAVIAIAWFGIQTYLASIVLRVLLTAIWPGLAAYDQDAILGLSSLGWATFVAIWCVQLLIFAYGMEMVRRYESFAGPVILLTVAALAAWMYLRAGASIAWSSGEPMSGSQMWLKIFGGAAFWVTLYGTMILNFCDFARGCPDRRTISVGNFWGLPVNILLFGLFAVVLAGAQFRIDGQLIQSPTDIVAAIPDTLFLVLASLALLWGNRLLPTQLAGRDTWEIRVFCASWALVALWAIVRRNSGTLGRTQLRLAAVLALGLPLLGLLRSPEGNLLASLQRGDWVLAGVDLSLLGLGLLCAWLGWRRRQASSKPVRRRLNVQEVA